MLIDVHGHQLLPAMLNQHSKWGPFWEFDEVGNNFMRVGKWKLTLSTREMQAAVKSGAARKITDVNAFLNNMFTLEKRLAQMDARGVDKLVVSVPSHWYMYWTEPEFGDRYARLVNDSLAEFCAGAPERLNFWAHCNLGNPKEAPAELERAFALGGRGLSMGGTNFGGLEIHDRALYPVWEKLCEHDFPLFIHGYNQSVTWGDAADTEPYEVTTVVGMPYDESRSFWQLISGGVLDNFPQLKIYITHGGGYVPYQLGRFAAVNEVMVNPTKNKKPLEEYLPQFYFDPLIHALPMRQALLEVIGADRLVYGDNFGGSDGVRGYLTDGLRVSNEDLEKIHWKNAASLLRIEVTDKDLQRARERRALAKA